jgi:flagellar biosynthesis GTPase FlhF
VTWLATGQAVPEDLELATVARLIELARHGLIDDQAAA